MSLLSTIWEFPISYQYGMTIGPEKVWYVNCSNYHKDLPLHLPNFTWWLCAKTMYLSTNWRRCKIVWIYLWWSALCPGHQRRNTWVSSIIWDDYIRYINIRYIKEKSIRARSVAWVGGGRGTNDKSQAATDWRTSVLLDSIAWRTTDNGLIHDKSHWHRSLRRPDTFV